MKPFLTKAMFLLIAVVAFSSTTIATSDPIDIPIESYDTYEVPDFNDVTITLEIQSDLNAPVCDSCTTTTITFVADHSPDVKCENPTNIYRSDTLPTNVIFCEKCPVSNTQTYLYPDIYWYTL